MIVALLLVSDTALPRRLDDDVLGRAYGLAVPASLAGIVVGSLMPLIDVPPAAGGPSPVAVQQTFASGARVRGLDRRLRARSLA